MFDVVHLCVERDPVRVATGLAVAGLAAAGPAVAGLAMAGLVAAGLAEAGLVEQRVVHLHEEGDAVVVGQVKGEPDKVSGKDVGHGGSGATEPILYLAPCVGRLLLPLAVQRAVPPVPPHDENEKRMRKGTRRPRARKELSLARFLEKMLVPVSVSFVSLTCKVLVLTVLILVSFCFLSFISSSNLCQSVCLRFWFFCFISNSDFYQCFFCLFCFNNLRMFSCGGLISVSAFVLTFVCDVNSFPHSQIFNQHHNDYN